MLRKSYKFFNQNNVKLLDKNIKRNLHTVNPLGSEETVHHNLQKMEKNFCIAANLLFKINNNINLNKKEINQHTDIINLYYQYRKNDLLNIYDKLFDEKKNLTMQLSKNIKNLVIENIDNKNIGDVLGRGDIKRIIESINVINRKISELQNILVGDPKIYADIDLDHKYIILKS